MGTVLLRTGHDELAIHRVRRLHAQILMCPLAWPESATSFFQPVGRFLLAGDRSCTAMFRFALVMWWGTEHRRLSGRDS